MSSEEQEVSVQKMLSYVSQMPHQENFQPPPLPFVSFGLDEMNVKYHDNNAIPKISHFDCIFCSDYYIIMSLE